MAKGQGPIGVLLLSALPLQRERRIHNKHYITQEL
jgi:hypothetical protein